MYTSAVAEQADTPREAGATPGATPGTSPGTAPGALPAEAARKAPRGRLRRIIPPGPIGWGAFLACSWTWCIGMFLPVLLLRDYGAWGWWVFAVPNVLGAAAIGWTLRDPAASRALQSTHLAACRAFSWVTLAFHAYFVVGLLPGLFGDGIIALTAIMLPLVVVLRGRSGGSVTIASAIVLSISVVAMVGVLALQGVPQLPEPAKARTDLLWLAPVCLFGFFLDPYVDLTFHRARQMTTRAGGRTAFGVGFGVFFLLMIVFTAIYAAPLVGTMETGLPLSIRRDTFAAIVAVHIAVQAAFTMVAHLDSLQMTAPRRWQLVLASVGIVAIAGFLRVLRQMFPYYHGPLTTDARLPTAEVIYRAFMAFYGLVFPAYVWLFVVPRRARGGGITAGAAPTRGQAFYFAAVTVLAAPMYWVAFIEGRMAWLAPGLILVLLARFLLPRPPAPPTPAAVAPAAPATA